MGNFSVFVQLSADESLFLSSYKCFFPSDDSIISHDLLNCPRYLNDIDNRCVYAWGYFFLDLLDRV